MTFEDELRLANDDQTKFKVWHIPQIPMKPFEVEVASYSEAEKVMNVLADYDLFQYENKVKGDYVNAQGIMMTHPELTDGEWADIDPLTAEEYGWKEPEPVE